MTRQILGFLGLAYAIVIAFILIATAYILATGTKRRGTAATRRSERAEIAAELVELRRDWAAKFGEYECLGGPLDGQRRKCLPYAVVMSIGGYYSVDRADCRLHFHPKAPVSSSWMDGL